MQLRKVRRQKDWQRVKYYTSMRRKRGRGSHYRCNQTSIPIKSTKYNTQTQVYLSKPKHFLKTQGGTINA